MWSGFQPKPWQVVSKNGGIRLSASARDQLLRRPFLHPLIVDTPRRKEIETIVALLNGMFRASVDPTLNLRMTIGKIVAAAPL